MWLCSCFGRGIYPSWWGGLWSHLFWGSSISRSGGVRLVWRPWEFMVEFVNNCRRRRDILPSYVAMLLQGWESNLLVELKAGGIIGFITVSARTWRVGAHHCWCALPRDPPWWWVVCGQRHYQRLDRTCLWASCWGRLCLWARHAVYYGRSCWSWKSESLLPVLFAVK